MFGNRKMYKRGLADAMQAYEGFSEKQQAALEKLRQDVNSGGKRLEDALTGMGDELNGIYQYLNSREKATLYRLEASLDLKDLEEPEQQLLLAVLYQLADDEGERLTDHQRAFIRSIQRYMGITNPQTSADLTAVCDIDSLDVQKAFLRVTLEFFYLQEGEEITEEQEDFLSNFSVNKRQANIIENSVSRLYNAMSAEGIAEKYGYVVDEEESVQESDPSTWEEYTISSSIQIGKGETVVHKGKILHINAEINCNGKLLFENCQIHYAESRQSKGQIKLGESGSIDFVACTIECHAYISPKENDDGEWDLSRCSLVQAKTGNSVAVLFTGCSFVNCCQLVLGADTNVEQCVIRNPGPALFYNITNLTLSHTKIFLNEIPAFVPTDDLNEYTPSIIQVEILKMTQCETIGVLNDDKTIDKPDFIRISGKIRFSSTKETINDVSEFSVEHCLFHDIDQTIIQVNPGASCAIRRSAFERCTKSREIRAFNSHGYLCGNFYMINCRFDDCGSITLRSLSKHASIITLCQFNGAAKNGTILIYGSNEGGLLVYDSEFNNWPGRKLGMLEKDDGFTNEAMITLERSWSTDHSVMDCVFQSIHAEDQYIISGQCYDKTKSTFAAVENCKFIGCSSNKSEFVPRQCGYTAELFRGIIVYRTKMTPAISISGCTGLEHRRGETASQVNIVPRTCGPSPESIVGPTEPVGLD